jgi:hypothetical protein
MKTCASTLLAAFLALSFIVPPAGIATDTPERSGPPSALAKRPLIVAQYDPCANNGCAEK